MDELIEKTLCWLKLEFMAVWGLFFLLVTLYEIGFMPEGALAGDARTDFVLQTAGILLTVGMIPVSLRLFSWNLTKRVRELSLPEALKSYRRWNEVRLSLLFVAAILNLSFYYLTMNTTGLFCGLMALLATLFCLPTRDRLLRELDIVKNEGE